MRSSAVSCSTCCPIWVFPDDTYRQRGKRDFVPRVPSNDLVECLREPLERRHRSRLLSASAGLTASLLEMVAVTPRTVFSPNTVYWNLELGELRSCGEGEKPAGCCNTVLDQLPACRELVSTTVTLNPSIISEDLKVSESPLPLSLTVMLDRFVDM